MRLTTEHSTNPLSDRNGNQADASVYNPEYLRRQARWIRDHLDPQIASNGPNALHSDDILTLDEFLRRLLVSNVSLDDIRSSRIHSAIIEIAGHATRWPKRLIERCEALEKAWEKTYGPLREFKIPLYEPGGRLNGVCKPEELDRDKLVARWMERTYCKVRPEAARKAGDLMFKPGDWWIHPIFAFRDGIIDNPNKDGSITSDAVAAYAILMMNDDEIPGPDPDTFTYRAKEHGRGRYRLTACTRDSRVPIRILRSHTLQGFWSPRAGVRYDGLHKVTGFSLTKDKQTKALIYNVHLKKIVPDEETRGTDLEMLLSRPWSDEVDDYNEYRRLRLLARGAEVEAVETSGNELSPISVTSTESTAQPMLPSVKTTPRASDQTQGARAGLIVCNERKSSADLRSIFTPTTSVEGKELDK